MVKNAVTNKSNDEIITPVHNELERSDDQSFGLFSEIYKKLGLLFVSS
jgi:hypothetical protein